MLLFTQGAFGNDKTMIKLAVYELNNKLNGKDTTEEERKMSTTAATRYFALLAFFWS